jgi:hypothetical protein
MGRAGIEPATLGIPPARRGLGGVEQNYPVLYAVRAIYPALAEGGRVRGRGPTWATPSSTSTSPPPYPTTAIRTATSTMRELLFEDHDVLMLVNPALDGIKDSDITGSANLHPRDWVKPFP